MIRPNIDARGVRMRLASGLGSLSLGIAVATLLMRSTASAWWQLAVIPLFLGAGLGLFQARYRTCVAFAARGVCDLGNGIEKIQDRETLAATKAQSRRVWLAAWLFAVGLALFFVVLKSTVFSA